MADITEAGIVSIDLIHRHREALPDLDAFYLLRPDSENIDRLLEDFKLAAKPQHNQVHLAFTQPLTTDQLDRLASGPNLPSRLRSLVEVPLSFVTIQDRGFHFDMKNCLPFLFPKLPGVGDALVSDIGTRLVDVCRCLQTTVPAIRHGQSQVCKLVADQLQQELAIHKRPNIGSSSKKEVPCQILILDRSVDMAATLVHDYCYEAMAYDVLDTTGMSGPATCSIDIDRHIVRISDPVAKRSRNETMGARKSIMSMATSVPEPSPGKEALLSDADLVWERLKHEHIVHAREELQRRVTEICKTVDRRESGDMDVSDLLNQLRKTPEHKDTIMKLQNHLDIITAIEERMREEKLSDGVGQLEQNIACGVDGQGREVKPAELQTSLTSLVNTFEGDLSGESKLRLLMLYFTCMANVPEQIRQKLISFCNLRPEDNHTLMSFFQTKLMEVPESQKHLLGQNQVHRGVKTKQTKRYKQNASIEGRFELSRFDPKVKEILEQLSTGKLSDEDFPRLGDDSGDTPGGGSLRAAAATSAAPMAPACDDWSFAAATPSGAGKESTQEAPSEVTQRYIVFIIGGVTYTELRVASEVMKQLPSGAEVLMGGTSVLTPRRLIQILRPRSAEAEAGVDPEDLT
jgi:syntaxin-binding protein 1